MTKTLEEVIESLTAKLTEYFKKEKSKELQAVLDEAKKYEIKVEKYRPFVYLEDLEFIIKDRMR